MRYQVFPDGHMVWLCDRCGIVLTDDDPGTVHWDDPDRFLETVGTGQEEETELLCKLCLKWDSLDGEACS